MQLQSNPMTVATYLKHYDYPVIRGENNCQLVQLKNLKLIEIELKKDGNYTLQETTLGIAGERWENINASTVVERIQWLEGGDDTFYKAWHVDDVLSLDRTLNRGCARMVLQMAIDNHDPTIGINLSVLRKYIKLVLNMVDTGII
jgi:hypothetical protein